MFRIYSHFILLACSWFILTLFSHCSGFILTLSSHVHDLFSLFSHIVQDLFWKLYLTCSWFILTFFLTLFLFSLCLTCSWFILTFFSHCSGFILKLYLTCSWFILTFFSHCSGFILTLSHMFMVSMNWLWIWPTLIANGNIPPWPRSETMSEVVRIHSSLQYWRHSSADSRVPVTG